MQSKIENSLKEKNICTRKKMFVKKYCKKFTQKKCSLKK